MVVAGSKHDLRGPHRLAAGTGRAHSVAGPVGTEDGEGSMAGQGNRHERGHVLGSAWAPGDSLEEFAVVAPAEASTRPKLTSNGA